MEYSNSAHLVYFFPIWTLATWSLILVLAWCIIGLKKKVDKLTDKVEEVNCKQDAYFGLPKLDGEAVRVRDMEVRRIREEYSPRPSEDVAKAAEECEEGDDDCDSS